MIAQRAQGSIVPKKRRTSGRVLERIPTIKDLVRRLKQDPHFRWECGFIFSDRTPSEASYSRFIKLLADTIQIF